MTRRQFRVIILTCAWVALFTFSPKSGAAEQYVVRGQASGSTAFQFESVFDRDSFLKLIERMSAPSSEELRPFYRRPTTIPLRDPRWIAHANQLKQLGQKLFFDENLSKSGTMSCASCHELVLGGTDGRRATEEDNSRRSMALLNLAWDDTFLWNGRAGSLMSQSVLALTATRGMNLDLNEALRQLNSSPKYRELFEQAFGGEGRPMPATVDRIAQAFEVYVSSIVSEPTAFDLWVAGDKSALSDEAQRGFMLFNGKAGCARCHNSWRFSDGKLYNIGLPSQCAEANAVTELPLRPNRGLFKAVGLRSIAKRPPYMHDGSLKTLPEVVDHYNRGGRDHCKEVSPLVRPLGLTSEEQLLVARFLETL